MERKTKYLLAAVLLGPLAVFPAALFGSVIIWLTEYMPQYNLNEKLLVSLVFATMGLFFAYPLTLLYGLSLFLILKHYKYERLWIVVIGAMIPVFIMSKVSFTSRMSEPLIFYGYFAIWVSIACWLIAVWLPNRSSNKLLQPTAGCGG